MKKWMAILALIVLASGITGCAAFLLGSVVGSLSYAGYQYANASASPQPTPQGAPDAQPTLTLNDIE